MVQNSTEQRKFNINMIALGSNWYLKTSKQISLANVLTNTKLHTAKDMCSSSAGKVCTQSAGKKQALSINIVGIIFNFYTSLRLRNLPTNCWCKKKNMVWVRLAYWTLCKYYLTEIFCQYHYSWVWCIEVDVKCWQKTETGSICAYSFYVTLMDS